ncbi:MAG: hypothetical protein ABI450_12515 [Rhizomicrobium sp.]
MGGADGASSLSAGAACDFRGDAVAASSIAKGEPSVGLFGACAKLLADALLALSEAAIKLVESAGKIQIRMFIGRAHATASAENKARAGPEFLPLILRVFPIAGRPRATQRARQFMPRPANSAALGGVATCTKPLDFPGKIHAARWHKACDIVLRQQSIWNLA